MSRILGAALLVYLWTSVVYGQGNSYTGSCQSGNVAVTIPGTQGSGNTKFQQSYPSCTVTVYIAGTVTTATIYSDNNLTALGNPFTAANNGRFTFYAAPGQYDVKLSGGGIPAPFTLGNNQIGSVTFDCSAFAGANAGVKIANCITALPSTGGVADARNITGTQTLNTVTITKNQVTLKLGAANYTGNIVVVAGSVYIEGVNQNTTTITCSSGYCITFGDSVNYWTTPYGQNRLAHINIEEGSASGCVILYRSPYATLDDIRCNGSGTYGFRVIASDSRVLITNVNIGPGAAPATGISIENGSNQATVQWSTILATSVGVQTFNSDQTVVWNNQRIATAPAANATGYAVLARNDQAVPAQLTWLPANYAHDHRFGHNWFENGCANNNQVVYNYYIGLGPLGTNAQNVVNAVIEDDNSVAGLANGAGPCSGTGGSWYHVGVDYAEQTYIKGFHWSTSMTNAVKITANAAKTRVVADPRSLYNTTGGAGLVTGVLVNDSGTDTTVETDAYTEYGSPAGIRRFQSGIQAYDGTLARMMFFNSGQGVNAKIWSWDFDSGGNLCLWTLTDGNVVTNKALCFTRVGTIVASPTFFAAPTFPTNGTNWTGQAFSTLGAFGNGTLLYCNDCQPISNPCVGGGSGAYAERINGIWACNGGANQVLSTASGSIGGGALTAGQCASTNISITGLTTGMALSASPTTYPGDGFVWYAYATGAGTGTVKVCAIVNGTPTSSTYNVRVNQ